MFAIIIIIIIIISPIFTTLPRLPQGRYDWSLAL